MSLQSIQTYLQPLRFLISSGLATSTHWIVMAALIYAGSQAAVATGIGAMIGAVVNYLLQRKVTFRSSKSHATAVPAYLLVVLITWCANLVIFISLHHGLAVPTWPAQVITTLTVAVLSYLLYKRIVFNERR